MSIEQSLAVSDTRVAPYLTSNRYSMKPASFACQFHSKFRWLWPHLLAETAAVSLTMLTITLAGNLTTNDFVLVIVSVASSITGYYGVIVAYHWMEEGRSLLHSFQALILEYGSAEVLDCLIVSPLLLYLCLQSLPNLQFAVVLSDLASSAAFYVVVAFFHAIRKA